MQIDKKTIKTLILGIMGCIFLYWFLNDMERVKAIAGSILSMLQPFLVNMQVRTLARSPSRRKRCSRTFLKAPLRLVRQI